MTAVCGSEQSRWRIMIRTDGLEGVVLGGMTRLAGPRLNERGVNALAAIAARAAAGWLELERGSALVVVGDGLDPVHHLVGQLCLPLHGGASPPLSVLFASSDAEDFGDEIVGERLPVVLHHP